MKNWIKASLQQSVEQQWYRQPHWLLLLAPLSLVFMGLAWLRKKRQLKRLSDKQNIAPVIVVGNITVGGTGKTPVVIALAHYFLSKGFRPGIISRGYGSQAADGNRLLPKNADASEYGDEPVMIFQATECPVMVGSKRIESAVQLSQNHSCDVLISDDGLQHYRLPRTIEIALIDASRRLGNGWCLPVGPLRESPKRLREVDFVLINGENFSAPWLPENQVYPMKLKPIKWRNIANGTTMDLADLELNDAKAIAGIGNPERFFLTLKSLGFDGETKSFPDHYSFSEKDFPQKKSGLKILMTQKDAVKCRGFAEDNWWALEVHGAIDQAFYQSLLTHLDTARTQ